MSSVVAEGSPTVPPKRSYTRRIPMCRLCLEEFPKDQLKEIFVRGSDCKRRIFETLGIKPNRNDRSTRLCPSCRTMVDVIFGFQQLCQQTDLLLSEGHTLSESGWKNAADVIGSVYQLVAEHRESIRRRIASSVPDEPDREVFQKTIEYNEDVNSDIKDDPDEQGEAVDVGQKSEHLFVVEVKKEEDEEQITDVADMIEYDEPSDFHDQDTEPESTEEQKTKTRRRGGRKKLEVTKRMLKNEKVMCDTCGELVSQISLEGHLNRHLGVKPFVCEIEGCGRQLYSKYSLQQHRHLHKSINRFYDCADCGKRIKGTNCWLRHRKLHTEEPKFACDVCGKKFRRRFGLKIHSVVHTGVALYPCEICGKHFTVKHNLGAHYRTHMKNGTYPGVVKQQHEDQEPAQQRLQSLQIEQMAEDNVPIKEPPVEDGLHMAYEALS